MLKSLLHETDGEKALAYFNQLKSDYFSDIYSSIYANMGMFYERYSKVPTYTDLATFNSRNHKLSIALSSLELVEVPELADLSISIDELINQYAQNKALDMVTVFIDQIHMLNHEEIKEHIGAMPLDLDKVLDFSDTEFTMNQFPSFKTEEESEREQLPFGLSNKYDRETGGLMRTDFVLLGGKQGSGKSLVSMNVCLNSYLAGYTSIFFSIEVKKEEVKQRFYSMLTGIDPQNLKLNKLTYEEKDALALAMVGMAENGHELYDEYIRFSEDPDFIAFDTAYQREAVMNEGNQFILIDNSALTFVDIDMTIAKFKARFGDKLALVVVDYINRVTLTKDHSERFDWKEQASMAALFKDNLARKYDVALISPYQIDEEGRARFAKALLDPPDVAILLHGHQKKHRALGLEVVKSRSSNDEFKSTVGMEWDAVRVNPQEIVVVLESEEQNGD